MGNDIQKGTVYAEGGVGGVGTVNAENLNAHVDEARIKASFISSKTLRDPATLGDSIVLEAGGVLYRATVQQIIDLIGATLRVPIGTILDFAGSSAPGGWLLCFGQTLLRTGTYEDLFNVIGTTYGSTDSSNFLLPDLRGRVAAGKDDMGTTPANRLTTAAGGVDGVTLGAGGGSETNVLTTAQLPIHSHGLPMRLSLVEDATGQYGAISTGVRAFGGRFWIQAPAAENNTNAAGSGTAHPNVQPTVIINKMIRYQ